MVATAPTNEIGRCHTVPVHGADGQTGANLHRERGASSLLLLLLLLSSPRGESPKGGKEGGKEGGREGRGRGKERERESKRGWKEGKEREG